MTKCQEFPIWFCFYIIMMPYTLLMPSIKEIYGGSSSVVSVTDLGFDFTVAAPKDWPQEAAAVHNQTFFRFFFFNFQKLNLVWFPSSELLDYNNQAFGPILAPSPCFFFPFVLMQRSTRTLKKIIFNEILFKGKMHFFNFQS